MTPPLRIAVTLGDPRGIGPEITEAALRTFLAEAPEVEVTLFGADAHGEMVARSPHASRMAYRGLGAHDAHPESPGRISVEALREGTRLCLEGRADALVTGPVHKPSLHRAGARFPGQTEFLQSLTGAREVGMLMAAESSVFDRPIRILLATTHLALREVPDRLTHEVVVSQCRLLDDALRRGWGIAVPTLALCALNPHASDSGLFGDEEARVLTPAVEALREEGLRLQGPMPADTVFLELTGGRVDGVVVPYHDVGMAVFKTLAFGQGVNVTLGLPFLRTSPDHGTAFDLVGTGRARHESTLEALRLARRAGPGLRHVPAPTEGETNVVEPLTSRRSSG
jgi:4-hydroxythreonine-4-phosphate dehydrogenase